MTIYRFIFPALGLLFFSSALMAQDAADAVHADSTQNPAAASSAQSPAAAPGEEEEAKASVEEDETSQAQAASDQADSIPTQAQEKTSTEEAATATTQVAEKVPAEQSAEAATEDQGDDPAAEAPKADTDTRQKKTAEEVAGANTATAAEQPENSVAEPDTTAPEMTMGEIIELLKKQQEELTAQRRLLESQTQEIQTLTRELDALRAPVPAVAEPEIADSGVDESTDKAPVSEQGAEKTDMQEKVEAERSVAKAQEDDPTRALLDSFEGAWRLPGTNAALAIGGYVKTAVVYNFDPLEINDRFIVGSIPSSSSSLENLEAESSVSASQSRLNFDLREPTDFGILRAFIEADFAGEGDTFRLRHAFGQWNKILAGKTWSAFVDTKASPEEVDFEGLNGRINVRQSQVRLMPTIGEKYEFQLSLEDPSPEIQNGQGVTRAPDIVLTGRFEPRDTLHLKASLLARQIRGQSISNGSSNTEKTYAWGLSLSGRRDTPWYNDRDSLLFQLNVGDGIGRYVNDLSSVGNFDGIFDPNSGDLELFEIISGYASWQHWWGRNKMRSNFTLGWVEIDNPDFVVGDAYRRTIRFSSNLIWSPTPRIDIGGEYLWGTRENEDGSDGDAKQIQFMVRYRF